MQLIAFSARFKELKFDILIKTPGERGRLYLGFAYKVCWKPKCEGSLLPYKEGRPIFINFHKNPFHPPHHFTE